MTTAQILDEQFLQLAYVDQLEAVTFITRRTDDNGDADDTEYEIDYALPGSIDEQQHNLGDVILTQSSARGWTIRKSDLDAQSITPQEGDVIKMGEESEWTVRRISLRTMNTRYFFTCSQGRD